MALPDQILEAHETAAPPQCRHHYCTEQRWPTPLRTASELSLFARGIPLSPFGQLLPGDDFETSVASKHFVQQFLDPLLVALDLVVLAVVKLREAQTLVGIEDDC